MDQSNNILVVDVTRFATQVWRHCKRDESGLIREKKTGICRKSAQQYNKCSNSVRIDEARTVQGGRGRRACFVTPDLSASRMGEGESKGAKITKAMS